MFYNCVNLLKLSIILKKKGFFINNNKKNLELLKVFLKINIIKYVKIEKYGKKLFVCINYINNKPVFKNIVNLYKPSRKYNISLKTLECVSKNHNWIIILSTNKGIINNFEAVKYKTGGVVLAKIWN